MKKYTVGLINYFSNPFEIPNLHMELGRAMLLVLYITNLYEKTYKTVIKIIITNGIGKAQENFIYIFTKVAF